MLPPNLGGFLGLPISTPAAIGTLLAAPIAGLVLALAMAVTP
jgi:uncharacterized membrane protein YczE